jgi:aspartyl/asparaginyl-tRNA synthetase
VEVMMGNKRIEELDKEWLQLVEELMESNISKNEFRAFLELKKIQKENK